MTTTREIETCAYCDTAVEDERTYRRHLHDAHDPAELGAIDRRRYERYQAEPNAVAQAGSAAVDGLGDLRYPVGGKTMARYAVWGFLCSVTLAAILGVGL
ncbi:MAG: hypothetical protein ABEI96_02085 [Haloarculaceae archaeon]